MNNIFTIARITYREAIRQPLFYIVLGVSIVLLLISPLFSLFAFGEEVSMIREVGLATIAFAGILIAILTASLVITSEIENLTAIMLLSKPVKRSEFILGKFFGIMQSILIAFVVLSLVFIVAYWLKEGLPVIQDNIKTGRYLKGETTQLLDTWNFIRSDVFLLMKGIVSNFLQVAIICSFATFFATYFSLVLTGVGCFAILIMGNISDYLYLSMSQFGSSILKGVGFVISSILPHFTIINTSSLVTTKTTISLTYILLTSLYTVVYVVFILYLTITIFQKREIR